LLQQTIANLVFPQKNLSTIVFPGLFLKRILFRLHWFLGKVNNLDKIREIIFFPKKNCKHKEAIVGSSSYFVGYQPPKVATPHSIGSIGL
jgi:hypothetical protein